MMTLGILSFLKPTPYMTKIAQHSVSRMTVFHFTPQQLTWEEEINGLRFCPEKLEWVSDSFPIPSFIYDRCFYSTLSARGLSGRVERLKQDDAHRFLGYGLPNKWIVYQALSTDPALSPFFPRTLRLTTSSFLLANLQLEKKWLLKPIQGSQGKGLIKVEASNGLFQAKEVNQPGERLFTFRSSLQFQQWLHTRMQKTSYIFQPFLPLQNEEGCPFDIRLLLQKDGNGEWQERIRIIRTGIPHHITSNLAGGGKMHTFTSLSKSFSSAQKRKLEDDIRKIVTHLPVLLEKEFRPLFELGVDLGLDNRMNLWILDINSKPGHKIVTMTAKHVQQEIYEAPSKYCAHLDFSLGNKMGVE
ncbi:YheC/YheD family protein [Bacillus tianshenii]|uniref:YheC/YheD family endospore coat-associated protein n=1 Tax=Sutcliffiella tianshenii TaxID=1463404 RepID=UPI001CD771B8|nr:YheC/YheD family protein [Bacillus tianshenii]MCA1321269.1 YheC/YheD family protein [Bacillus tianshenii]